MMIFIQKFLPIHFNGNSTDKNLTLNFNLNRFLCGGGLNFKFCPNRFLKTQQVLIRGFLLYSYVQVFLGFLGIRIILLTVKALCSW